MFLIRHLPSHTWNIVRNTAIDIIFKQLHYFRTAHLVPHLGVLDLLAVLSYQRIRIERVGVGNQLVIIRMFAFVLTVWLTAAAGLLHSNFGQHVGIIGCCNLAQAVLIGPVAATEHHELGVNAERNEGD